jgi:hypothetical protein
MTYDKLKKKILEIYLEVMKISTSFKQSLQILRDLLLWKSSKVTWEQINQEVVDVFLIGKVSLVLVQRNCDVIRHQDLEQYGKNRSLLLETTLMEGVCQHEKDIL